MAFKGWPIYSKRLRSAGTSFHELWSPTAPPGIPPAPVWPHGELPHTVEHLLPGKVASRTLMNEDFAAKEGHDSGAGIVHLSVPLHVGLVKHDAFSSWKLMVPAGSVILEGTPIAVWDYLLYPKVCMNPFSLPAGPMEHNVDPTSATVRVGYTLADVLAGLKNWAIDTAFDVAFFFLWDGGKVKVKKLGEDALKALAKELAKALQKAVPKENIKEAAVKPVVIFLLDSKAKGKITVPIAKVALEVEAGKGLKLTGPSGKAWASTGGAQGPSATGGAAPGAPAGVPHVQ